MTGSAQNSLGDARNLTTEGGQNKTGEEQNLSGDARNLMGEA